MQKIINFRPLLNIFFVICMGVTFSYAFLTSNLFLIITISFLLLAYILRLILKFRLPFLKTRYNSWFFILLLVVFLVSFLNFKIRVDNFKLQKLEGNTYTIEARITDKIINNNNYYTLYLENATAIFGQNTLKLTKQLKLNVYINDNFSENNINTGNLILFVANVYDYNLIKNNKLNTYNLINNIGYYANVNTSNLVIYNGAMRFDEQLRLNTKSILSKNLSYDNANLSYAVLFGDKSLIETEFYEQFQKSGIAHILAVSGLHIGFLVAIILLIFSLIKMPKKLQFLFLLTILTLYSYFCGFSPSVMRASIMAIILLFGHLIGERNDNLSNLMFAGALILLINPVHLFTAGFLLSFASVFGIFLLYPIFTKWFYKIKTPTKLAQMLAITLSAQIATLPIIAHFFKEINLIAVVSNLLVIPIFTVGYFFLFVLVIFTSIFSFFSVLFVVPTISFSLVHIIAKLIANLNFFVIHLFSMPLLASIVYFLILFVASQFVLLKQKQKLIIIGVCLIVFVSSILTSFIPANYNYDSVIKIDSVSSASVITTKDNLNYLIDVGNANSYDEHYINSYLSSVRIFSLDAIILTNYNEEKQTTLCSLVKKYNVKTVFIPHSTNNILLFNLIVKLPTYTDIVFMQNQNIYTHKNLLITNYSFNERGYLLKINTTYMQCMFTSSNLNTQELTEIANQITSLTSVLVMDKMTNFAYDILSQSVHFNEIDNVLVQNNQITTFIENIYDTKTQGHLQVTP